MHLSMSDPKHFYITTTLPYVNAEPHIGFAMEIIRADAVARSRRMMGDLVFFNTMRLTFSHVGIYVGDNKFIHSPSKGTNVRVDDLGSLYWDKRFDGARRLDGSDNLNDSERQELLNEVKNLKRKSRNL